MPRVTIDKNSSDKEIDRWISYCIRYLRREGKPAKQAAGQCYGMARQATGKPLDQEVK